MNSPDSGRRLTRLEVLIRAAVRGPARVAPAADGRQRLLQRAAREQAGDPLAWLAFNRPWQAPVVGALDGKAWAHVAYFSVLSTFGFSGGVHVQIR